MLAHEVGHHVQNVLGILDKVHGAEARLSEGACQRAVGADGAAGGLSGRRLGATTREEGILDEGDIDEALTAARAVGDDAIQQRTQGYVVPETLQPRRISEQRKRGSPRRRKRRQ